MGKQDSQGTLANQENQVLTGGQGNQVSPEQQAKEESEETLEFWASQVSKVRISNSVFQEKSAFISDCDDL